MKFEDVKRLIESGQYAMEFGRETNIHAEMEAFSAILPILGARRWTLLVAGEPGTEFVSSDMPVTVVWKDPAIRWPVGLGLKKTELVLPLNRRHALLGMFEDELAPAVVAQKVMVATINLRTTAYAERHVFAGRDSYLTINDQGEIYEYQADISP